jgi:hypothetical protein
MMRILFVGQKPETVDFSDPAIPPGFDAAKINAGIEIAVATIAERGWKADLCMIPPDERAGPMLEKQLASERYDCVVIGAGLRLPPRSLSLFERVLNTVHKAAPDAAIAFNTHPEDTAEAAGRWLQAGG